jgi:hypothetical protein
MKLAIGFLGGSVFSALAVILAGGRSAVMLWLGFTLALAAVAGILWLAGIRRTARFLGAFADAWGAKDSPVERTQAVSSAIRGEANIKSMRNRSPVTNLSGYVKPSRKQQDRILEDTISEYLDDDIFSPPSTSEKARVA